MDTGTVWKQIFKNFFLQFLYFMAFYYGFQYLIKETNQN